MTLFDLCEFQYSLFYYCSPFPIFWKSSAREFVARRTTSLKLLPYYVLVFGLTFALGLPCSLFSALYSHKFQQTSFIRYNSFVESLIRLSFPFAIIATISFTQILFTHRHQVAMALNYALMEFQGKYHF